MSGNEEDYEDGYEEEYEEEYEDSSWSLDEENEQFEEITPQMYADENLDEFEELDEEDDLDEFSQEFVDRLIDKMLQFMVVLVGHDLHPYQKPLARRMMESIIINDGEEITALAARQSGKSETIADTVSTLMVLLPRLAKLYPELLGKYKDGLMVGLFAPTESQAETLFSRTVTRLSSERALDVLSDPEIDDIAAKVGGVTKMIKLKKSGSTLTMMTANPRAKIESKSFHLIVIDECQEADDFIVNKSISPMRAYYAGTMVKTGTPTTHKNNF
jgi:phage terminase large subunit-like protein